MIKVRGQNLNVDIEGELKEFNWKKPRWKRNKLIACSPFRNENKPSFACSLETGIWVDSGADAESEFYSGNFIKLLAYLRGEPEELIKDYLLEMYSPLYGDLERMELNINLQKETVDEGRFFTLEDLEPYAYKHPYLTNRGISEKVQRAVKIGYDPKTKAVVIPWFDRKGNIVNMKFRSVVNKQFWYAADGKPIENYLYLLDLVYRFQSKTVYITEGEIDALTLWQAGYAAIALGHGNFTEQQKKELIRCPAETVVIAVDNDKSGQRIKDKLTQELTGFKDIKEVVFTSGKKDVNDLSLNELKNLPVNNLKQIRFNSFVNKFTTK